MDLAASREVENTVEDKVTMAPVVCDCVNDHETFGFWVLTQALGHQQGGFGGGNAPQGGK